MIPRLVLLLVLLLGGCHSRKHGQSGVRIMDPLPTPPPPSSAKASEVQTQEHTIFSPARPYGELAKPEYPTVALAAKAGNYEAYMKLSLDERGEIIAVEPSLRGISLPHPHAEAFHAAIRQAVKKWQFRAACLTHYLTTEKAGVKTSDITRVEFIPETLDIHFTFEASGTVR